MRFDITLAAIAAVALGACGSDPDRADAVSDTTPSDASATVVDSASADTAVDTSVSDAEDTRADDTNALDSRSDDTTADDTMVNDTLVDDTLVDDTSVDDTTVDDTTVDDTSVADTTPVACPTTLAVTAGSAGTLLRGLVVLEREAFVGEVLVQGHLITCVDVSCASAPGAAAATIVDTAGLIFPGLVDTHDHVLFDAFDHDDWSPLQPYTNHNQWPNEARYGALVDAKQYLNGETGGFVSVGCELDKHGELQALVSGTTSVVGAANPQNKACYASLARTIDQSPNGLDQDKIQVATLFPSSPDAVCANFTSRKTDAYLVHVAEGVGEVARKEFDDLGCLVAPETTIVHGTALGPPELDTMAQHSMGLVWSPSNDVHLYGGDVDLTKTANIPYARAAGITVALGTGGALWGSHDLLEELRFAQRVDQTVWGAQLSAQDLVAMVTINAARVLALDATLGSLTAGKRADITVIAGDCDDPWQALIDAHASTVRLVMVDGVVLYGDMALRASAPSGCETIDACGVDKFVCVATTSSSATDKLGQTLAEIESSLTTALSDYDALHLSVWSFSPLAPLIVCP